MPNNDSFDYVNIPLVPDPTVKKHVRFWGRYLPMMLASFLGLIILTLFFVKEGFPDVSAAKPEFTITQQKSGKKIRNGGSVFVGDTLVFQHSEENGLKRILGFLWALTEEKSTRFTWDMGDNSPKIERAGIHKYAYEKAGIYLIQQALPQVDKQQIPVFEQFIKVLCKDEPCYPSNPEVDSLNHTEYQGPNGESFVFRKALDLVYDHEDTNASAYTFTYLASLLPILFLISLVFLIERIRLIRRREALTTGANLSFLQHTSEPYVIPWPNKDNLLSTDTVFRNFAEKLRGVSGGKKSEYLVLIEQKHPQDHLAKLYSRLVKILAEEGVSLSCFYFDTDIRILWNEEHEEGIGLEELFPKFHAHRLLIYSDGHDMVDPYNAKLKRWVKDLISKWEHRAVLVTHVPPGDWGFQERVLFPLFFPVTAELAGQLNLVDGYNPDLDIEFKTHKADQVAQYAYGDESMLEYDFEEIDDLRIYLNDSLFEYVSATMVYPLPVWSLTLSIGRALSAHPDKDYFLAYDDLLRLARIPWMQTRLLPPRLRKELLDTVSRETEQTARKTLLKVLEEVEAEEGSYSAKRKAILQISNEFLTNPGNEKIARKMYALWQLDQLQDTVLYQHLNIPLVQLQGDTAGEYLKTRFEKITTGRVLLKALGLALPALLGIFYLQNTWDQKEILKEYSQKFGLEKWGLTMEIPQFDRAVFFHDRGVEAFLRNDLLGARLDLYQALQLRHFEKIRSSYPDTEFSTYVNEPFWEVEVATADKPAPSLRKFSVSTHEDLVKLDAIPNKNVFDRALFANLSEENLIHIDGKSSPGISFTEFPQFNSDPSLILPYLFFKDYPLAGKHLLTLMGYNEGIAVFNALNFDSAATHFVRNTRLFAGNSKEDIFHPLYVHMLDGAGLSYYYAENLDLARDYVKKIQAISPRFYSDSTRIEPHLAELVGIFPQRPLSNIPDVNEPQQIEDTTMLTAESIKEHIVQRGETLFSISQLYGMTVRELQELNDRPTQTPLSIGEILQVDPSYEKEEENLAEELPEYSLEIDLFHTVTQGETLYSLSKLYGQSVPELIRLNKLEGNEISIGQQLLIRKAIAEQMEPETQPEPSKEPAIEPEKVEEIPKEEEPGTSAELPGIGNLPNIDILSSVEINPKADPLVIFQKNPTVINLEEINALIGYPKAARDEKIEGEVLVRVLIDEWGNYVEHKVIEPVHPSLIKAVEEHIHKFKFTPGIQGEKAVQCWMNFPFVFKLKRRRK